tara:strand:- start:520 stop:762 length:243 start_codon:yes stop_codon:yes gene_type:complete
MTDRKIQYLLGDLCVQQGFCLPPKEQDRIASIGTWEAESFAKDVVASEGLNPEYETKHVRNIRNKFIEVFGSNVYSSKNS